MVSFAWSYPKTVTQSSLIGHWTMDQISGTTVQDSSGKGGTGTTAGSPSAITGLFGTALKFNGSNNRISCVHKSAQDLAGGGTVSAWIRPVAYPDGITTFVFCIVDKDLDHGFGWRFSIDTNGNLNAQASQDKAISSSVIKKGIWTFVSCTFAASGNALVINYINGKQDGTLAGNSGMSGTNTSLVLMIGANTDDAEMFFKGDIDDVRLYSRVLSPAEIFQLYASGKRNHP